MALYKDGKFLQQSVDKAFDYHYEPGSKVPHSGIYRCYGCGNEIASNAGDPFPPQNHHQHTLMNGDIRWQLIVYSVYK